MRRPVLLALVVAALVVGCGEDTVGVPNVEGDFLAAAEAELEALGFGVEVNYIDEAQIFGGEAQVSGQAPSAGDQVEEGSTVTLIVDEP